MFRWLADRLELYFQEIAGGKYRRKAEDLGFFRGAPCGSGSQDVVRQQRLQPQITAMRFGLVSHARLYRCGIVLWPPRCAIIPGIETSCASGDMAFFASTLTASSYTHNRFHSEY